MSRPFVISCCCFVFSASCGLLSIGCAAREKSGPPSIEITSTPAFRESSSDKLFDIEGRASGVRRGERVVLYARAGLWWVQPTASKPITSLSTDARWRNKTHPGSAYAALLVGPNYQPPARAETLPEVGHTVLAVAKAEGDPTVGVSQHAIRFHGYNWGARSTPSNPGGGVNEYDPGNAWTDDRGFLRMRISGTPGHLKSSEVYLNRSLGYGTYRFVVRDVSHLDPSVAFVMTAVDDTGPWREMNIELSQWGQPGSRNGQFVIQPYYIPSNTFRFLAPTGRVTFILRWSPDRAEFEALPGGSLNSEAASRHVFTSAVPPAGDARVHLSLYVFDNNRSGSVTGAEIVVENFEFLP
jgi:hypothetical protein